MAHEPVLCDNGSPPCYNTKIKSKRKQHIKKFRINKNDPCIKKQLNLLQDRITDAIETSNQKYDSRMTQ